VKYWIIDARRSIDCFVDRFVLRQLTIVTTIVGFIWFVDVFVVYEKSTASLLTSTLTFINSCQGVFIWLVYCLLPMHIQHFYRHLFTSKTSLPIERMFDSIHIENIDRTIVQRLSSLFQDDATYQTTSDYSCQHSSDFNKQILTIDFHPTTTTNRLPSSMTNTSEYLSSLPANSLNTHSSTFGYSSTKVTLPSNTNDYNEQLLTKYAVERHRIDDHQYYEIG
jgi:uncharacterized protein with PQ loop repeat